MLTSFEAYTVLVANPEEKTQHAGHRRHEMIILPRVGYQHDKKLVVLDLALYLFDIRQEELQLIITLSGLLQI
jgi:hypothetical protein